MPLAAICRRWSIAFDRLGRGRHTEGMTPLRTWLTDQGRGALARLHKHTGIPLRTLHRYINGTTQPPIDVALRISAATNHEIVIADLVLAKAAS